MHRCSRFMVKHPYATTMQSDHIGCIVQTERKVCYCEGRHVARTREKLGGERMRSWIHPVKICSANQAINGRGAIFFLPNATVRRARSPTSFRTDQRPPKRFLAASVIGVYRLTSVPSGSRN